MGCAVAGSLTDRPPATKLGALIGLLEGPRVGHSRYISRNMFDIADWYPGF